MNVPTALAFLAFFGVQTIAMAQEAGRHEPREQVPPGCHGANSRLITGCPEPHPPPAIKVETRPLNLAPPRSGACHAGMSIEYGQWDTVARVRSVITNADCAASRGRSALGVKVLDSKGELKTRRISESWDRNDDRPVVSTKDYPIGSNADLVSVLFRRLQCICVDKVQP